jgi:GNAT superfamily N-acetyltransferase
MRSKAYWGYTEEFMLACRDELSHSPEQIEAPDFLFKVAEVAGAVAAFYALARISSPDVELEALFVEPDHIARGIGRALIEDAKKTAASLGAKRLVIQGDPHAERFYRAAGGTVTGERESSSIPGRFLPVFTIELPAPREQP